MRPPALNADEIATLLHEIFPQAFFDGCGLTLENVEYGHIRVRRAFHENHLRPGGTISGPTMMELADFGRLEEIDNPICDELARALEAALEANPRPKETISII